MADIDTRKEAVERLLDGVTHGPWTDKPREIADADDYSVDRQEDGDDGLCYSAVGVKGGQTVAIVVVPMSFGMDHEQTANARFIATARQLVPALSRDLEVMRDENAMLRECVANLEGFQERDAAEIERLQGQLDAVREERDAGYKEADHG